MDGMSEFVSELYNESLGIPPLNEHGMEMEAQRNAYEA